MAPSPDATSGPQLRVAHSSATQRYPISARKAAGPCWAVPRLVPFGELKSYFQKLELETPGGLCSSSLCAFARVLGVQSCCWSCLALGCARCGRTSKPRTRLGSQGGASTARWWLSAVARQTLRALAQLRSAPPSDRGAFGASRSNLSADLQEVFGFRQVLSIDYSDAVISHMKARASWCCPCAQL